MSSGLLYLPHSGPNAFVTPAFMWHLERASRLHEAPPAWAHPALLQVVAKCRKRVMSTLQCPATASRFGQ